MRHTKLLGAFLLSLTMGVMAVSLPMNVLAIKEVTPTPNVPAPQETSVPEMPATPDGSLEEQLQAAYDAFEQGDYQETIEITSAIVEQYPDTAEAYLVRGIAYSQMNNVNRAIDDYTRAIRILPYDWTAYTFRAAAYAQSSKIGEALNDYDKAIELNPRYAAAYTGRAQLLDAQGDSQNARIDQLIAEGITRMERQDLPGAISRFTAAIDVDATPERRVANAYYNRALAHFTLGDLDESIADYTAGLELDPDMHDLYLGRGIAYRQIEELQKAGEDFGNRIYLLADDMNPDTPIDIGTSTEVEMAYGRVYRFIFEGQAGQRLTFTVRDAEGVGVDPLIVLRDQDGMDLAGDDDFGGELDAEIANFELPDDGTYTLIVSHANGGYSGLLSVLVSED